MDAKNGDYQAKKGLSPKILETTRFGGMEKKSEVEHLEAELRLTLEEIARLQNALAESNMKNVALQASLDSYGDNDETQKVLVPLLQELKQPIHTIQGYLDLLLNESVGVLGTFQKRFVERIANAIEHMEKRINHLEVDSEDSQEELRKYSTEFSLTALLEDTLALYSDLIRTRSITLKVNFEKDEVMVVGDKDKLERVLNLLLTNGLSCIAKEGILTLGIKYLQGKKPAQVLVSIQSNDHENARTKPLPVNLNEFKELETILEGFGASLNDLVRAKTMVEDMQGSMEIFSLPACGSLTRIRFPVSSKK
jgi:signal transduction histidine kinase